MGAAALRGSSEVVKLQTLENVVDLEAAITVSLVTR